MYSRHELVWLSEPGWRRAHASALPAHQSALLQWQAESVDADRLNLAEQDREIVALKECLRGLPAHSADVISAFYFRRETAAQTATRTGKKEGAIYMTLLRIRQTIC